MPARQLSLERVSTPLHTPFTISRGAKTHAETVQVTLTEGSFRGRGECVPYSRYDETVQTVVETIETVRAALEAGLDRFGLQDLLPAGAARCAIDCALWDLDAKIANQPVWSLAGLPQPRPIETAVTITLDTPDAMAAAAASATSRLLKLKLGGPDDLARIEAVHQSRTDARLILDANEGLQPDVFPRLISAAAKCGVVMIEQPFPAGKDSTLLKRPGTISICADESAHTSADIQALAQRYDAVNVKLDKAGGLTEAIAMVRAAQAAGMGVMVGCMVAGSLAMASAALLAQLADAADLDGPLWLAHDIADGLIYEGGRVSPPVPALWG